MSHGLHVVLGASGGAGGAITRALADAGISTRAVARSAIGGLPGSVERIRADITTETGLAGALDRADVVYMAAQPPYHRWSQEFPAMLERVVDGSAGVGAKLVMVDNLYAYGPGSGTITEDSPERAADAKGVVRRGMSELLRDAHRAGTLRVAVGRASDYFGPGADNSAITALAIEPIRSRKTLRWPCDLDTPHSVAFLPDIGRAYVVLGTSEAADGGIWILPHAGAPTGREFLSMVNSELSEPLRVGVVSKLMLRLASPFHKPSRELAEIAYQWEDRFVADDAKFQRAFGPFEVTPIDEAIAVTVARAAGNA